jgi:hypothetical protein
MKRNGNLLWITALCLTRVFKVALKTVQKCTVNEKSFNPTHYSTVWSFWNFVLLLNTKRCFVGRDIIHFSVRQVSDIPPWSLGFSPGVLPLGGNNSGASLLWLPSVFPCRSSFHIHRSPCDSRYHSNVLELQAGCFIPEFNFCPGTGIFTESGSCVLACLWQQYRVSWSMCTVKTTDN